MDLATVRERRSGMIGTILFHILLVVLFLISGLEMELPRPEEGILLNFGNSEVGSGKVQPDNPNPSEIPNPEPTPTEAVTPPVETQESQLTQDHIETVEAPKETNPVEETKPKEDPVEEEPKEPTLDPNLQDILNRTREMGGGGSEGNDDRKGDKGKLEGSKEGGSYTGNGTGNGGNGDYKLGGRVALSKIKPDYECDETGTVVVRIKVDKTGKTLDADLQLKGTTNSASCLVAKAIQAAKKTRWEAKPDAPEVQYGTITYRFQLQ